MMGVEQEICLQGDMTQLWHLCMPEIACLVYHYVTLFNKQVTAVFQVGTRGRRKFEISALLRCYGSNIL